MGLQGGKMLAPHRPRGPCDRFDPRRRVPRPSARWPPHGLMAMVEPFISHRVDGRVRNDLSTEAVVRSATVAAGLGWTSAYTWLKLPVIDDMEPVLAATTLPVLLLGGEVAADQDAQFAQLAQGAGQPAGARHGRRSLPALPAGRRRRRRRRRGRGDDAVSAAVQTSHVLRRGCGGGRAAAACWSRPTSAGWTYSGLRSARRSSPVGRARGRRARPRPWSCRCSGVVPGDLRGRVAHASRVGPTSSAVPATSSTCPATPR